MLLKPIFTVLITIATTTVFAQQNLVPNPSFEDYITCPHSNSQIRYSETYSAFITVTAWCNPVKQSTPDYFNACDTTGRVSVPDNFNGVQPARTGNAYTGIYTYVRNLPSVSEYAEYIYCKLSQKLIQGVSYDVSFYVSGVPGKGSANNPYAAVDRIGVSFSDTIAYEKGSGFVMNIPYSIKSTPGIFLDDTVGWTKISGRYTAKGGEEYLYIGNFWDSSFLLTKFYYPDSTPSFQTLSYYYIDDVSVTKATICDTFITVHDTIICDNDYVTLSSSVDSADSYIWSQGQNGKTQNIYTAGRYWVGATRDTCDYYIDSFIVRKFLDTLYSTFDTIVCQHIPYEITLRSSAGTGASSYTWSNENNTMNTVVTNTGIYSCTAIKDCIVYIDNITLKPKVFPYALDLGSDTMLCKGVIYTIGQPINDQLKYEWNTQENTCCINVTQEGGYKLTITDGCYSISDEVNIKYYECIDCISVPTAFTPNNDGLNDVFKVQSRCPIEEYKIIIVNRWGEQVFTSDDVSKGWDGTFKGRTADIGAYHYLIKYKAILSEQTEILKGDINLIR